MKALIVDDDAVSRMALVELLSSYGIDNLAEAGDGEAAWRLLEEGLRPAICFCDVRMPRMSGIGLLERMKADPRLAAVPFVLVSSASDRDTVLQAVTLGAVGYILKPLHAAEARAHLDKIFRITLDKLAEDPAATLARLNIGATRLAAYLDAFGKQLAGARAALGALFAGAGAFGLAESERADVRRRVDALHTGCLTLGLWQAASLVAGLRDAAPRAAQVEAALGQAAEAVTYQSSRLRAAFGADMDADRAAAKPDDKQGPAQGALI